MTPHDSDITRLLRRWREGDRQAEEELFAIIFPNLRRLAHYLMRQERNGHTLQATELVDQLYLTLVAAKDRDWESRQHLFALSARAMRRHLSNYARGRGNAEFVALDGLENLLPAAAEQLDTVLTVDGLLDQLAETNPDWCRVIEVKYFLGLTDEQAAEALGMKLRTLQRMWLDAREWLFEHAGSGHANGAAAGR